MNQHPIPHCCPPPASPIPWRMGGVLLACLCLIFSYGSGCGTLVTQEPSPQEQPQERASEPIQSDIFGPPEQQDSGQEQAPERAFEVSPEASADRREGGDEPTIEQPAIETIAPDGGTAPDRGTGSDGGPGPDVVAEMRAPEQPPESGQESQPDGLPALQAKAVSLRASFLQDDLQSGLMERSSTSPGLWTLELVIPQGQHTFAFVLDGLGSWWGTAQAGAMTGALVQTTQLMALTAPQAGRYRVVVELDTRRWAFTAEQPPASVAIKGSWSGTAQTLALQKQTDGSFSAQWAAKRGAMTWHFVWTRAAGSQSWGSAYPAYKAFPQGGVLQQGGADCQTEIPVDGLVKISLWPGTRRWQLEAVAASTSGVAAWDTHVQSLAATSDPATRATLTRQWLQNREAIGGLPLRDGGDFLFVVEWKTQGPVYVAGSFNQWSTQAAPMQKLTGTDVYFRKVTLGAGHHEYKFVDSSAPPQWILDPHNKAIVYGGLGPNSVVQVGRSGKHQLRWHSKVAATQLANTRDVFVYLPPDYELNSQTRYPVIYMHDGQNLFDPKAIFGGWDVANTMDGLIAQQTIRPAIVVGMANTPGRMSEYTHVQDRIGGQTTGGQAKQYADFVLRDLKPWIDGLYRTKPGHRTTGTMGSSLGGLISMWLGVTHPDVFFRIAALSSTFGWGKIGANATTLIEQMQGGAWWNIVTYLDSGSPNDNFAETIQMRDLLEKKGFLHDLNLQHWTETGASHNETEWRKRLFRPLTFLLRWE